MSQTSDAEFDEFVAAAWSRLCWTAYLLVGDRHLAEDLTQTALVKTYASWRRVRREDALAYTRKVLLNTNIDRMRRRRVPEMPLGSDTGELPGAGTAEPVDAVTDRDTVVRLLGGLTDQERRVVVLRYVYDLTEPMVAAELGVSVGTVKSTTSRALAKLRVHDPTNDGGGAGPAASVTTRTR